MSIAKGRDEVLSDEEARGKLRGRTRRSLLTGGIAAVAGIAGYSWLTQSAEDNGTSWPLRRVLDWNGRLWHRYVNDAHLMPSYSRGDVQPLKANGDVGLTDPIADDWSIHVTTGVGPALKLGLADIKALPKVEMITRFCCIEGWSTVTQWAGARFSEFTRRYFPPGHALPPYVYLTTPDELYYAGLDTKSALHPQTLLAYEQNGSALTPEHGAPLRLVIPVKYGIKNLKRIGAIQYVNQRPADYWAEEGYDWFAGL